MKLWLLSLIFISISIAKITIESNYPLRNNNFSSLREKDVELLVKTLRNLRDIKNVKVVKIGNDTVVLVNRYPILKEVDIQGNWFVSDEDIKSITLMRENEPLVDFSPERAENMLKMFYAKQGFLDAKVNISIKVDAKGYAYGTVKVREGDLYFLKDVVFSGAYKLKKAELVRGAGLRVGDIFNEREARNATLRVHNYYRESGFLESSVYFEGIRKEPLGKPFPRVLMPASDSGSVRDVLFSLFRGVSNLTTHPIATLKALLGKGSGAVPIYNIHEGDKFSIEFRGNKSFTDEELMKLVDIDTPGVDIFFLESTKDKLERFYRQRGFFEAVVEYTYSQGTIEFLIKEGPRYQVAVSGFKGIDFPKEYDRELIEHMVEEFLKGVRKRGYLTATVEIEERVDRSSKKVLLSVEYNRGKKIWLKDVRYTGSDRRIKSLFSKYRSLLPDILSDKLLDELHRDIKALLWEQGYLDGDFSLEVKVEEDDENMYINHIYTVKKGKRYRYGKLLIYGNEKTHPREIYYTVVKQKFFSSQAEEESLWNLVQSENFTGVRIQHLIDRKAKVVHRLIEVREDKRGVVEGAVGYNTEEKLKLEGALKLKNLFGVGIILRLGASKSEKHKTYEASLSDKFLFSRKYFASISFFRKLEFHRSFDLTSEGFSIWAGYRITRWFSISSFVSKTTNVVEGYGRGNFELSKVGILLLYERKNDPINPDKVTHVSLQLSKAQGDKNYLKAELNTFILREITKRLSLNARAYLGRVGKEAPVFDRFFLGGLRDVRGYSFESIGYPLGGSTAVLGRLEVLFSPKKPFKFGLYTSAGGVGDSFSDSVKNLKHDIGIALGIDTPAGFLRLDIARALENLDKPFSKLRFYLSIGFVY